MNYREEQKRKSQNKFSWNTRIDRNEDDWLSYFYVDGRKEQVFMFYQLYDVTSDVVCKVWERGVEETGSNIIY